MKTSAINNRRYLGNKYKLLSFIKRVADQHCKSVRTVADIFAGTGAVASAFIDKKLITNDLLYSNYMIHLAWFHAQTYERSKIVRYIEFYNQFETQEENYMRINFADTYFSADTCSKIGWIREDIERAYRESEINDRERALLITSLLYAMDKIANTCGHYDAYRRHAAFDKVLELAIPVPADRLHPGNQCFNVDANQLVRTIRADLVYIDPPYNSRQYSDAYHLIENVARWEKPDVQGIARKMDRSAIKSAYCTRAAVHALEELIRHIQAKYILFSYNNMAEKGNGRSNAKISDEDIYRILRAKGEVRVFSERHKAFTAGKSNIQENEERLFFCRCHEADTLFIASPLNYTGGKYKLLHQMMPLFPEKIDVFLDLFCGGCNVGLNVKAKKIVCNDHLQPLYGLLQFFKRENTAEIVQLIEQTILNYGLSQSTLYGYAYYGCDSGKGLSAYNKKRYMQLRQDFNQRMEKDDLYFIMLYVLIVFSFNNQIRFNRKGEFNLPVGKRDFNAKMREKLLRFLERLKGGDSLISNLDFREINLDFLTSESLVYADPPYLITCAAYNEQNGWNASLECELLQFLDALHARGIRFALSNVLRSKGKTNQILLQWIKAHMGEYYVHRLDYTYANANYQKKRKNGITEEVLIVNYSI